VHKLWPQLLLSTNSIPGQILTNSAAREELEELRAKERRRVRQEHHEHHKRERNGEIERRERKKRHRNRSDHDHDRGSEFESDSKDERGYEDDRSKMLEPPLKKEQTFDDGGYEW